MTFKLKNYIDVINEFELSENEVENLVLLVLSGDEVLYVEYKDHTTQYFDSDTSGYRGLDCFDSARVITLEELKTLHG